MRRLLAAVSTTLLASSLLLTSLTGCEPAPLHVSADVSCELFRQIRADAKQKKVYSDNWEVMESHADQLVAHNDAYECHCLNKTAPKCIPLGVAP